MAHSSSRPAQHDHRDAHIAAQSLREIEQVERALRREIRRLCGGGSVGPASPGRSATMKRPAWWWREKLTAWVEAGATREAYPPSWLDGLAAALQDFDDDQLAAYVASEADSIGQ